VVTAGRVVDHPAVLGDPTRSAHRQYQIESASAFVIRPDAYIGYRGRPVDADRIMADLAARLSGIPVDGGAIRRAATDSP
jgi:hypothetical protein